MITEKYTNNKTCQVIFTENEKKDYLNIIKVILKNQKDKLTQLQLSKLSDFSYYRFNKIMKKLKQSNIILQVSIGQGRKSIYVIDFNVLYSLFGSNTKSYFSKQKLQNYYIDNNILYNSINEKKVFKNTKVLEKEIENITQKYKISKNMIEKYILKNSSKVIFEVKGKQFTAKQFALLYHGRKQLDGTTIREFKKQNKGTFAYFDNVITGVKIFNVNFINIDYYSQSDLLNVKRYRSLTEDTKLVMLRTKTIITLFRQYGLDVMFNLLVKLKGLKRIKIGLTISHAYRYLVACLEKEEKTCGFKYNLSLPKKEIKDIEYIGGYLKDKMSKIFRKVAGHGIDKRAELEGYGGSVHKLAYLWNDIYKIYSDSNTYELNKLECY